MHKIGKNAVANIITKLWLLISIYIFIPFYIQILGEESYGIVSFFATMQSAINILGLGLANTLRREFAVKTENAIEDNIRRKKLLNSIEILYFGIAILISIICYMGSEFIASKWLNIGVLDPIYVANTVSLMGLSIALQIVANLYSGCIFGLDMQTSANVFQILWSVVKYCGSLYIISFVTVDLRGFYLWHVIIDVLYLMVLRLYLQSKLTGASSHRWSIKDFSVLKGIWEYALGILVISVIALVNKQLDKIIISKLLTLTELGAYNLATTLGNLTTIFAVAMNVSVFPNFTGTLALGDTETVEKQFLKINKLVNIVTACLFAFVAVFAIPLIQFWTGTTSYNDMLILAAPLVVIAIAITEFQEIPYALALANGNTKINVILGISYLPIVCASTWFGIKNWGLVGASVVYLVMMASQTIIYEFVIYKKYLNQSPIRLIITDTILPIIVSLLFAFLCRIIVSVVYDSNMLTVIAAVLFGMISLIIELFIMDRSILKKTLRRKYDS